MFFLSFGLGKAETSLLMAKILVDFLMEGIVPYKLRKRKIRSLENNAIVMECNGLL